MSKSLHHFDFNFPNCIGRHYLYHSLAAFSSNWLLDNDDDDGDDDDEDEDEDDEDGDR